MTNLGETELKSLAETAVAAARTAGDILLSFYCKEIGVNIKKDGSPLTMADSAANDTICKLLSVTGLPVVSEENTLFEIDARYYWLVDPLDGTKDFLAANDEFSINIALIEDQRPVIGVVYAPALDELYIGIKNTITRRIRREIDTEAATIAKNTSIRMAVSRFHDHEDARIFAEVNQIKDLIGIGAAIKYGRLAFGAVDVYPRLVGTSEWDTAAGQVVLEGAGGSLLDWHTGLPLLYNKPNRRNGRFISFRAPFVHTDFIYQYFEPQLL